MIPLHRLEETIPDLTGMAVLIIAGCAFALSFFNLQAAALEAGISPWLSWLWPVCIDALLIAGSLMILRSSIRNESPLVGWIVLLSFTGVSTVFNVLHSPADVISQAAHAVPPIALCVSIELLMMTIRSDLLTPELISAQVTAQVTAQAPELIDILPEQVLSSSDQATEQIDNQPEQLLRSSEQVDRSVQVQLYFTEHPGSSVAQAARDLNMSRHTVKKHKPVEPVQEKKPYGNEMYGLCSS